jgi:hypothetical protein
MNAAIAILTGLLVVVTAYYAWQTRQTVRIMEAQLRAGVRPLLLFALRDSEWRIVNTGKGAAVNGRWETSYRKVASVQISRERGGEPGPGGSIAPLGPGEALEDPRPHFEDRLHALLTYEDLGGVRYWTRYCPRSGFATGVGAVASGDFGCRCKRDERGHIARGG